MRTGRFTEEFYHLPDWLEFVIEANILQELDPVEWAALFSLTQQTCASLKLSHPSPPVFVPVQTDFYWVRRFDPPNAITGLARTQTIAQMLASSDLVVPSAATRASSTGS